MERVPILLEGARRGELLAEEQGLYVRYQAVCRLEEAHAPVRLFAVGERGELRLGVLQPEGGRFVLCRQLPRREAGEAGRLLRGELRSIAPEERGWQYLADGELRLVSPPLRRRLRETGGALICRGEKVTLVALPFDSARPFPLPELFCLASIRCMSHRAYVVYGFDAAGRPCFS